MSYLNSKHDMNTEVTRQDDSIVFNGTGSIRNRERYSILEMRENKKIEEFKNKGKKTLLQF